MMKNNFIPAIIVLIICASLLFTGCGRGRIERNRTENDRRKETSHGGPALIYNPENVIRLYVSGDAVSEHIARQAFIPFQQRMALEGIAAYLDFSVFLFADVEEYYDRLLSRFEAGIGPDLFLAAAGPGLIPFMDSGFLGDFYALIDQSPTMSRDDFFMNVLEPLEVDGRLYYMPMKYFIEFIGINANVPQGFIDRFAALERVSVTDIIALYFDLINEYPEFADYALIRGMSPAWALVPELGSLLDVANRSADFSSINTLFNAVKTAFANNNRFDTPFINVIPSYEEMEMLQSRYIFTSTVGARSLEAFIDYSQPFFVHHIPRVDESGRMMLSPRSSMAISHTANPAVLYFIKYYIQEMTRGLIIQDVLGIPILRQFYPEAVETSLHNHFYRIGRATDSGPEQIPRIIYRMNQYIGHQSTMPVIYTLFSDVAYINVLTEIMETDIPTHEAVRQLEQYFSTWLNPEFEITPLPVPAVADANGSNTRTLTVMAWVFHEPFIRQAAAALNNTWAQEGREYRFDIIIDSYGADMYSAHERLRIELMAGGGPDLLIWSDALTRYEQPLRALARSGLMANIYDLIDECPHTSRDDFFTQALNAYEMSGELYMFPLSFGFYYVAINTNLPQSAQDRFAQFETISINELILLYHEIIAAYGDEFSHLGLACQAGVLHLRPALLNGFIDFNARRSNLMDERFISLLENWATLDLWPVTGQTPIDNPTAMPSTIRNYHGNSYMFMIDSDNLQPARAFFTLNETSFAHHIPLTDEQGRLLMGQHFMESATWATVCMPAAGDSALAWEFTRYLISAYSQPIGTWTPGFGTLSLTSPIQRSLFEGHVSRALEHFTVPWGFDRIRLVAAEEPDEIARQIDNAVTRIAAYNEMPLVIRDNMIPRALFREPLIYLERGILTPREAAQRLHNSISLWLIE